MIGTGENAFVMASDHVVSTKILGQLRELDRIMVIPGLLPISTLESVAYKLRRYRSVERPTSVVDCFTTYPIRDALREAMLSHYATGEVRECPVGQYDLYSFAGVQLSVLGMGYNDPPALWFLDMADMTDTFDLMTPQRHLLIQGFTGFKV